MAHSQSHFDVVSANQLAALSSAARQEIIDVLAQMGVVSVTELAATLGRPSDAMYYHLRVLKRCGLVVHEGFRGEGKHKEELIRCVAPDLQLAYRLGPKGNTRQVNAIVSSMLRLGIRDFGTALRNGDVEVAGSSRELWALRKTGWLGTQEIVRLNEAIQQVADAASKPKGSGRLYGVTILLTPLDHRARTPRKKSGRRKVRSR